MRFRFRITKYDPAKRDSNGHYSSNEWTSFSDIGKEFNGHTLTESEYCNIESAYLKSINAFLTECNIDSLQVTDMECFSENNKFISGQWINRDEVAEIAKLNLREELWCKLKSPRKAYIHFGYDYYMYIGVSKECKNAVEHCLKLGLFVENSSSPYLKQ